MAEDKASPGGFRGFMASLGQWQVLLAIAVGAAGLLFNFNEQRRTELQINRDAVAAARSEQVRGEFRRDPQNTLAEFQATFPEHAFCAALGFFIAEGGRMNREAPGRASDAVRDVNDALFARVEAQAAEVGIGAPRFGAEVVAALAAAKPPAGVTPCSGLPRRLGSAFLEKPECRLVVTTYLLNQCNLQRDANRLAAAVRAEQVAMASEPQAPTDFRGMVVAPAPGLDADGACGGNSPLIYLQFAGAGDRAKIDGLRDRLLAAGWQVAPSEHVADALSTGDVRIYWEAQRPCAEELAGVIASQPEIGRPIEVISLAETYRGLPANAMELWLPPLD